jgi:hypothetical protein
MVYNTKNYWVFGLLSSSGILEKGKDTDGESQKTQYPLESTYTTGMDPVYAISLEPRVFYFLEYRTMEKVPKPVILSI